MLHPKFIIEGSNLIMGICEFHKNLATDEKNVKGGGWFRFDINRSAFILGGKSFDFGYPELDDIRECIKTGNIYQGKDMRMNRSIADSKFLYDTQTELIELN